MSLRKVLTAAVTSAALLCATAANAALVFVNSWQVDQGPTWNGSGPTGPLAYTAQETAALLFGGEASDYAISTQRSEVDFLAWYSILGLGVGLLDEDYSVKFMGQYYGPTGDHGNGEFGVASAYVNDWAVGERFTNYAFRYDDTVTAIPEPATWAIAISGFGLIGAVLRRRRALPDAA